MPVPEGLYAHGESLGQSDRMTFFGYDDPGTQLSISSRLVQIYFKRSS